MTVGEPGGRRETRDEDVAAVVAALAALGARTPEMTKFPPTRQLWRSPARSIPAVPAPGPDAWWGSGMPR